MRSIVRGAVVLAALLAFDFGAIANAQSIWRRGARLGALISDLSARQIGDILKIMISEQQQITDQNNSKIERASEFNFDVNQFQLHTHIPVTEKLPGVDIESNRSLDAKANVNRKGTFSTIITATVTDVLPNGNLVVKGRRRIFVDQEEKTIEITGIARPYDISPINTVSSDLLAEARITFIGEGPVAEASKKGWLARSFDKFWNFIWPF